MPTTCRALAWMLGLCILAACGSTSTPEGRLGAIEGSLTTTSPAASDRAVTGDAVPRLDRGSDLPIQLPPTAPDRVAGPSLVAGEIIVRYRDGAMLGPQGSLSVEIGRGEPRDVVELRAVRSLTVADAVLYRAPGLSEAGTRSVAERLALRSDVAYAVPNRIYQPTGIPNDTFYPRQWHYPAIRMPEAWDLTTGTEVVVGVVDSGLLHAAGRPDVSHPDLGGLVLPGFDFVSSPSSAGDGDGRDFSPYDLDDFFHGSHVAGTIAAAANNGRGVAGVNWRARIVPVRVLGQQGGSVIDIMEGALWAAGGLIPGVPDNPNPARIINMSLGGRGACSPYERDMFDRIFAAGVIVVVSAGNENDDASRYAPANCPGVITVGATDAVGDRAPYSNYGPRVDLMAPGGDTSADANDDGSPDGVLSLGFDVDTREFVYRYLQGTSMAAPHVTGVISLMLALEPSLTGTEALAILRSTAHPLTPASCKRQVGSDCGAGLIDAFSALLGTTGSNPPPASGGVLAFSPDPVDFGGSANSVSVALVNTGAASVSYDVSYFEESPANPGELLEGAVSGNPLSGTIPAGGSATLDLGLDRTKATADGAYAFDLVLSVGTTEQRLLVRFGKNIAASDPSGPTVVASFLVEENGSLALDANGNARLAGGMESGRFSSTYGFDAEPGDQIVIGWVDQNEDREIDSGDFIGIFPETVEVRAGTLTSDVDFSVVNVYDMNAVTDDTRSAVRQALERMRGE